MTDRRQEQVIERRVRPIYDALDSRNHKGALKLAAAALEKHPNSDLIKSIYAVSLLRMKRPGEADKICDELVDAAPHDDQTLHVLLMCLKDLRRASDITRVYDAAAIKQPNNPDVLLGLFGAHVREGAFAKQQQVATKLNKLSPGPRHTWWIVLSVMLQARAALVGDLASAMEPSRLLQLAHVMASRQADKDGRLDGFEALLVYVDVLLAQGKLTDAVGVVAGDLGSVASMPAERAHMHAALLMASGATHEALPLLRAQLEANPDDWDTLLLYLDCMMGPHSRVSEPDGDAARRWWPDSPLLRLSGGLAELVHEEGAPAEGTAAALRSWQAPVLSGEQLASGWEACKQQVAAMQAAAQTPPAAGQPQRTMRGPYLASLELAARAAAASLAPSASVRAAALGYMRRCSHLVSCAADLRPYWRGMAAEERTALAAEASRMRDDALGTMADASTSGSDRAKALRTAVCCWHVMSDLGQLLQSGPDEGPAVATRLMADFGRAVATGAYDGLDERERGPADELPCLAACALVAAAAGADGSTDGDAHVAQRLLAVAALLEAAVQLRPYNPSYRLALASLYCLLGTPDAAHRHVRHLEIKNIQMDTLGGQHVLPVLLAYAPASPTDGKLGVLLGETLSLYDDHAKNAADTLIKAHQHGSYSKVLEFVAFRERLAAAHTHAAAQAEQALCGVRAAAAQGLDACTAEAAEAAARLGEEDAAPQHSARGRRRLRFNEDVATRPVWAPPSVGPSHLEPAEWWGTRSRALATARTPCECWWLAAGGAAERGGDGGARMRSGKAQALEGRRALVRMLHAASATPVDAAALGRHARAVCDAAVSIDPSRVADALLERAGEVSTSAEAWGAARGARDTQLVLAGISAAAAAAAPLLLAGSATATDGATGGEGLDLARLSSGLAQLVPAVCARLGAVLSDAATGATPVLPGWVLNLATVLLQELLVWLGVVMHAWSRRVRTAAAGKPRAAAAAPAQLSASLAELKAASSDACRSLAGGLGAWERAAAQPPAGSSVPACLADHVMLWDWRPGFDAGGVLAGAREEQRAVAHSLCTAAAARADALHAL